MRAVSNSLLARILQSAEARPSAPALLADGTTMSYGELVALAESYATLLGLQPGRAMRPYASSRASHRQLSRLFWDA